MKVSGHDFDVFIRTVLGESEAWNRDDAAGVAHVILNRLSYGRWGKTIAKVCQAKWQFSCWNMNDPSRERIINAVRGKGWFAEVERICKACLDGEITDPTSKSTHYYATYVAKPKWADGKIPVHQVPHEKNKGHAHLYFNDIDTPKPLIKSKRVVGGTMAITGGSTGAVVQVLMETLPQVQGAITPLSEYLEWAKYACLALTIIGGGLAVYSKLVEVRSGVIK